MSARQLIELHAVIIHLEKTGKTKRAQMLRQYLNLEFWSSD